MGVGESVRRDAKPSLVSRKWEGIFPRVIGEWRRPLYGLHAVHHERARPEKVAMHQIDDMWSVVEHEFPVPSRHRASVRARGANPAVPRWCEPTLPRLLHVVSSPAARDTA